MGIKTEHLKCSSCGAPLDLPEGTLIKNRIKCPFCGVENFVNNEDISCGGMNFDLDDAALHKCIIGIIATGSYPPHDIYKEINIKKINKNVVPAYWYENCNSIGTLIYTEGIEKTVTKYSEDEGFHDEIKTEYHPMSKAFSDTRDYLLSGSAEYKDIINKLFSGARKINILKPEDLRFPDDCNEIKCDITEGNAYADNLMELAKKAIEEKGKESLDSKKKQYYKDIEGVTIQKGEVKKVSVALYEVFFDYKGKEYSIYISNNGEYYSYDEYPTDPGNESNLEQKKKELSEIEDAKKTKILFISMLVLGGLGILTIAAGIGVLFLIGAFIIWLIYRPISKEIHAREKALDDYKEALTSGFSKARSEFDEGKSAMKGVLNHVSGNPAAFETPEEIKASEEAIALAQKKALYGAYFKE